MIEAHPGERWSWYGISHNMKVTVEVLRQHADKPWDYYTMSGYNPSISLELLLATPDLPWNYDWMSRNKCLTMDMVLAFPRKDWIGMELA